MITMYSEYELTESEVRKLVEDFDYALRENFEINIARLTNESRSDLLQAFCDTIHERFDD